MRNPEDTKYVWDEKNFNIIKKALRNNSIDNMTDEQIKKLDMKRKEVRLERKKYGN